MAALALLLKIIGAITEVSSFVYLITAIFKKKKKHIGITLIILIVACILLIIATKIEDKIRRTGLY